MYRKRLGGLTTDSHHLQALILHKSQKTFLKVYAHQRQVLAHVSQTTYSSKMQNKMVN